MQWPATRRHLDGAVFTRAQGLVRESPTLRITKLREQKNGHQLS
jgi:hypothetical protein